MFEELCEAFRADGTGGWQQSFGLGLIEPNGSHLVRGVYDVGNGRISTSTPLPPYAAVQLMTADRPAVLSVVDGVIQQAVAGRDPSVLLVFDCVARRRLMGDAAPEETERITRAARGTPVFGMYTYGEFARTSGVGGVHNAVLTALAL